MSLGNTTETEILNYIFDSAAPAWAGNASFYLALYTSDPGEAGTATTNEVAYGDYARVAVSRTTGFDVTGNVASNSGQIEFPTSTSAGSNATHWALVTSSSGAGQIIIRGALSSSVSTGVGIKPLFAIGDLTVTLD